MEHSRICTYVRLYEYARECVYACSWMQFHGDAAVDWHIYANSLSHSLSLFLSAVSRSLFPTALLHALIFTRAPPETGKRGELERVGWSRLEVGSWAVGMLDVCKLKEYRPVFDRLRCFLRALVDIQRLSHR